LPGGKPAAFRLRQATASEARGTRIILVRVGKSALNWTYAVLVHDRRRGKSRQAGCHTAGGGHGAWLRPAREISGRRRTVAVFRATRILESLRNRDAKRSDWARNAVTVPWRTTSWLAGDQTVCRCEKTRCCIKKGDGKCRRYFAVKAEEALGGGCRRGTSVSRAAHPGVSENSRRETR
jgi:hypothetical protein